MKVPFFNMSEANELIRLGLMKNLEQTIKSGHYLFGDRSQELEQYFAAYFNCETALVGSGTDALIICLKVLGIKTGDWVAIPAMTAIPTAIAIKSIGAQIAYVDVDNTLTMDPEKLKEILQQKNIKAIIPVHLYGNSCNIKEIVSIANNYNIPIIEDCAQSFGTKFENKLTGTFGACGAFSFYPTKNLGCFGDGGLIISHNKAFIKMVKELRFYGQTSRYKMGENFGLNSRMDEIQCVILLQKIKIMETGFTIKRILFEKYQQLEIKSIEWREGAVPHLYPVLTDNRQGLIDYLAKNEIETIIHYPFYLEQEIEKTETISCPMAKKYSETILSIPFNPWLTFDEVEYLLNTLKNYS